jgi:hypothetical protein
VFFNLNSAHTNPRMQEIQKTVAPQLAAHRDAIFLNGALFARVARCTSKRETLGLDPESKRLLERYHTDFVRAGARPVRGQTRRSCGRSTPSSPRWPPPSAERAAGDHQLGRAGRQREELDGLSAKPDRAAPPPPRRAATRASTCSRCRTPPASRRSSR